ncbi:MAG: excisionase family DNA-binding protein [Planctomycetota bacterium]|nr:excisionase family DNA-binding protein [Verrucomicrobiota bacterium]MDA1178387.1 excisionase family DNA-binding protein [Planctomycetota bacterium]
MSDPATTLSNWLTINEAAVYGRMCKRTIERMIAARQLTVYRPVRRKRLISRQELDAAIRATAKGRR